MQRSNLAIGVFDSGMGGLTVLRALRQVLPTENFIYLGDTARLPYGTKSSETVQQYATQMTRVLVEKEIKALVIACNTATTAALEHLQALYPDLLVIGVVNPGAEEAVRASPNGRILVMATETTISSQAYHRAIMQKRPDSMIQGRACSLLVSLAEEGIVHHDITRLALQHYLQDTRPYDTLLLGCTHFPVFEPLLSEMLPDIQIVDSAMATANMVRTSLMDKQLLNSQISGHAQYLVTDAVNRFCRIGQIFLKEPIHIEKVQLIDAGRI
jgi:glutamate racemase